MEALFLKLVNMSISASWLVLAVVVLRFVMKKAPKWMTCALWAMVAIRLVFPFSIESAFSLVPDPDPIPPSVITNHTPIVAPADTPVSSDTPVISPGTPMLGTQADVVTPAGITELAATVWIVGVAALLIYALVSYLLIRRKVSASLHLRENIFLCDYIESPFILGILRPRIYLPSALDQSQWPHVLAHEQAHLHRRDHWWKPLGFAILCVYWFNPVLWLAYILLCRDIELACDERVIRDMDTRQKQDYTTALLECSMPRYLVAACPLAFGEVGVKERVKSVLNYKKPAFWIILIAIILCIAAAVCFLTDPVGSNAITPGVYSFNTTLYLEPYADGRGQRTVPHGQYILHNNSLYVDDGSSVTALGRMTPYDLDNQELDHYLRVDDWWQVQFYRIPTVSEALWLRTEDGDFYVWFQTTNGETYLARGVEDYGERYDWFDDDTLISHLCRLTKDDNAEEKELAWFDATVVKSTTTWITVEPDPGSAERNSSDRIEVSLYWHHSDDSGHATGILGEFQVGDRVRIVYDGQIQETYPARISNTHSVTMLDAPATPYAVISRENQVDPLFVPVNTDISTLSGLPVLKLAQNESGQFQFQLLRDGQPNPGYFRLYDYKTKEEIKNFHYFGSTSGPDWSLLEPGRNYIVVQERDGMICFIASVPYDFGITLTASDVTPTGMTVKCTQSGGNCPGEITYGNPQGYWLRRITDGGWENVPNLDGSTGVTITTEAYILERNSTVTWNYDWTNRFGTLEPGDYRFDLYFSHGEPLENDTFLPISVYFTIGDSQSTWEFSATVLEVNEGSILVEPLPGTVNHPGTNLIRVTRTLPDSGVYVQDISVGDIVSIRYDGKIAETYPGQINTVYDIQVLPDHPDGPKEPLPQWEVSLEVTHATSTEALIIYHINSLGPGEVWTGYDYHLEALTDEGWVHYGYPPEELAWESALLFHTSDHYPLDSQNKEIFVADWSRTADAPLPPGTYRYCKGVTIYYDGEFTNQSLYAVFEVPEDSPEHPGVHMEILNPTDTGATLAITYNGGLMGELSTQGKYYLMVDVGGGMTRYGLSTGKVDWDDVRYTLQEGETVYIDVRWDHTADAPLPVGTYYVVLTVDQDVPDNGAVFQFQKYITESFAITD